jgi:hypothetical protein
MPGEEGKARIYVIALAFFAADSMRPESTGNVHLMNHDQHPHFIANCTGKANPVQVVGYSSAIT